MLFLAECIRIFTTWQAISFKRKFYYLHVNNKSLFLTNDIRLIIFMFRFDDAIRSCKSKKNSADSFTELLLFQILNV